MEGWKKTSVWPGFLWRWHPTSPLLSGPCAAPQLSSLFCSFNHSLSWDLGVGSGFLGSAFFQKKLRDGAARQKLRVNPQPCVSKAWGWQGWK